MPTFALPRAQPVATTGKPYPGAKLYFYDAGTTTPRAIYSDAALATPLSNPVTADASGRFAAIYVSTGLFKVRLTTSAGVIIYEEDNVDPSLSSGAGLLPIASGGTGASTAASARTALGAASDASVSAIAADVAGINVLQITSIAGLSLVSGDMLYASGVNTMDRLPKGSKKQILAMSSGTPAWRDGTRDLITTLTLTGSTQWDVNNITDYRDIILEFVGVVCSNAESMLCLVSSDNGGSFTATGYVGGTYAISGGGNAASAATTSMIIHYQIQAADPYHGEVELRNFGVAYQTHARGGAGSSGGRQDIVNSRYNTARVDNAFRLSITTAPSAGTIRVWGVI